MTERPQCSVRLSSSPLSFSPPSLLHFISPPSSSPLLLSLSCPLSPLSFSSHLFSSILFSHLISFCLNFCHLLPTPTLSSSPLIPHCVSLPILFFLLISPLFSFLLLLLFPSFSAFFLLLPSFSDTIALVLLPASFSSILSFPYHLISSPLDSMILLSCPSFSPHLVSFPLLSSHLLSCFFLQLSSPCFLFYSILFSPLLPAAKCSRCARHMLAH